MKSLEIGSIYQHYFEVNQSTQWRLGIRAVNGHTLAKILYDEKSAQKEEFIAVFYEFNNKPLFK